MLCPWPAIGAWGSPRGLPNNNDRDLAVNITVVVLTMKAFFNLSEIGQVFDRRRLPHFPQATASSESAGLQLLLELTLELTSASPDLPNRQAFLLRLFLSTRGMSRQGGYRQGGLVSLPPPVVCLINAEYASLAVQLG